MPTQRNNRRRPAQINADERPTGPDNFVHEVINRTACSQHNASQYWDPCFEAEGLTEENNSIFGVCNDRAKAAGFNGTINPVSLTRRPFGEKTPPVAE